MTALNLTRHMLVNAMADAKVNDEQLNACCAAALDAGRILAVHHSLEAGGEFESSVASDLPERIACSEGLTVERCEFDGGWEGRVVFADYQQRLGVIRLYLPTLRALEQLLRERGQLSLLGASTCSTVYLAHELYHHFDLRDGLTVEALAPVLARSSDQALQRAQSICAEISAGAYAQELVDLPLHPYRIEQIAKKADSLSGSWQLRSPI